MSDVRSACMARWPSPTRAQEAPKATTQERSTACSHASSKGRKSLEHEPWHHMPPRCLEQALSWTSEPKQSRVNEARAAANGPASCHRARRALEAVSQNPGLRRAPIFLHRLPAFLHILENSAPLRHHEVLNHSGKTFDRGAKRSVRALLTISCYSTFIIFISYGRPAKRLLNGWLPQPENHANVWLLGVCPITFQWRSRCARTYVAHIPIIECDSVHARAGGFSRSSLWASIAKKRPSAGLRGCVLQRTRSGLPFYHGKATSFLQLGSCLNPLSQGS